MLLPAGHTYSSYMGAFLEEYLVLVLLFSIPVHTVSEPRGEIWAWRTKDKKLWVFYWVTVLILLYITQFPDIVYVCATLYYTTQHCNMLQSSDWTTLKFTARNCVKLYRATLHWNALRCTVQLYAALRYTPLAKLHCSTLYHTQGAQMSEYPS